MARRHVITLSVLAGLLSGAAACTPFQTPHSPPDAAPSDASGGGDAGGSTLVRVGFETLAPDSTTGGGVRLSRQRLSPGSSVTCNAGICFSGGIEP